LEHAPEFRAASDAENKRIDLILQIIRLRQQRGITQAELARAIGTQQSNISRLERFDHHYTVEMPEKIAAAPRKGGMKPGESPAIRFHAAALRSHRVVKYA
jgi:transcriptional regulator with XRE-family HTH domain